MERVNRSDWQSMNFFHCSGGQRVIDRAFVYKTRLCIVERDCNIQSVMSLWPIVNRLFGHSLFSWQFRVKNDVTQVSEVVGDDPLNSNYQLITKRWQKMLPAIATIGGPQ